MIKKITNILLLLIAFVLIGGSSVQATGGKISTNKSKVKPGETFELYVELSENSTAYEFNISENTSEVATKTIKNKIGEGDANTIYLLQLSENQKEYSAGTKVATLEYKVSDNAKDGDVIEITVKGKIAGITSEEKYEMEEKVKVTIEEQEEVFEPEKEEPEEEPEIEEPEEEKKEETTKEEDNEKENKPSKEDKTEVNKDSLPKTGSNYIIIVSIVVVTAISLILYKKSEKIKY